jgi:hypothetical protein
MMTISITSTTTGFVEGPVPEVLMFESDLSDTTTKRTRVTSTELAEENCLVKKNSGTQARKHNLDENNNNIDAVANSEASIEASGQSHEETEGETDKCRSSDINPNINLDFNPDPNPNNNCFN